MTETKSTPTEKKLYFLARQQKALSQRDVLGLLALGTLGVHLIVLFFLLLLYGAYSRLANKPPPSLVQLADGKAVTVAPLAPLERTPSVVKEFVISTLTLMMNWSGNLPPTSVEETTSPKPDPGVELKSLGGRKGKLTTPAWQAGFALSEDFRKEFLNKLAEITPPGVFRGSVKVTLVILEAQTPEKIAEGKWKIKIVANLLIFKRDDALGQIVPFNKEVFIQAVEPPKYPGQLIGISKMVYEIRSSGLEIYGMRDLSQEDLK